MKNISLALATLALISTSSAYAADNSANVGLMGTDLGLSGATLVGQPRVIDSQIISQPAVIEGSTMLGNPTVLSYPANYDGRNLCARRGLLSRLFGGHRTYANVSAFGTGVKLGGLGPDFYRRQVLGANTMGYPSSLALNGCNTMTFSSVIGSGSAIGLSGERIRNPWVDLSLFKFGFRAGAVNPRYDMRPAGL